VAKQPGLSVEASIQDIQMVTNALRAVDKTLPAKLRKLLGKAARPIMRKQRRTLRRLKGAPGTDPDLRDIVAEGLRLTVRTGGGRRGASYRIRTTMPPAPNRGDHWAMLPRGLDTSFNGWRSPFFGNRNHWVHHQVDGPSWFMGPADEAQPGLQREVHKILAMSADEIAAAVNKSRRRRVTPKGK